MSAKISRVSADLLLLASASFAQWESADSTRAGTAPAEASATPAAPAKTISRFRERMYRDDAAFGNKLYNGASIATWVGVGAFWGGLFSGQGGITALGFLTMSAGIPIMGVGAGKMQDAALVLNPEAQQAGGAGWGLYGAGVASYIAGIVVIGTNIKEDEDGELTLAPAAAITGLSLMAASQVLYYTGWYQFSRRRMVARGYLASFSMAPTLHIAGQRLDGAGVKLVAGF
jgi:hypothetical protein